VDTLGDSITPSPALSPAWTALTLTPAPTSHWGEGQEVVSLISCTQPLWLLGVGQK
jgi:hypothetical protein